MLLKGISLLLLGFGIFILMQVALPLVAFKVWELAVYDQSQALVDPASPTPVLGVRVERIDNFPQFRVDDPIGQLPYPEFRLTVPKLKLSDIKVVVASNDFASQLAHLPGTALPGERGNIFISGHSAISPIGNKRAFFANLVNLKRGDEVIMTALGTQFNYLVTGIKIVDPQETWVISPPDSEGRYLTLMTCVPPGFNTKRLVVLAKLKS